MIKTTIRRAEADDAPALVSLGRETFRNTFGRLYPADDLAAFLDSTHAPEKIAGELADPAMAAWLAEAQGDAIGYAVAGPCGLPHPEVTPACGELKRIYLLPQWQGGTAGRALMEAALAWLERDGPRSLWIGVWSENLRARQFYERRGFAKVGEYGFKVGRTVDREFILKRG